jgi:hypothetical protein
MSGNHADDGGVQGVMVKATMVVAVGAIVGSALLMSACESEASSPGANGEFSRPPYESGTEVGKSYSYQLY